MRQACLPKGVSDGSIEAPDAEAQRPRASRQAVSMLQSDGMSSAHRYRALTLPQVLLFVSVGAAPNF